MVRKPEKDQENQLTDITIEPHEDIVKHRRHTLVPNEKGEASIEHRKESLLPPDPEDDTETKNNG